MSLRLEMLQAAGLAPSLLLEAGERVIGFLHGQLNQDGGAKDRSGRSDLYYTVFALEGLMAMGVEPPVERVIPYLGGFNGGEELDLVHKTCLARCWAAMPPGSLDAAAARRILEGIESYRSADGGYSPRRGAECGTVYHCFLALGAYQDLEISEWGMGNAECHNRQFAIDHPHFGDELPNLDGLGHCLSRLHTDDGAYANEHGLMLGTTTATAAAVTLMRQLGLPVPPGVEDWLLARCAEKGGFLAAPDAPFPDLLSTATGLHALAGMRVSLEKIKEPCLDFLDSLWTGQSFCGHRADEVLDCEYTYYALLALGHLSL